MIKTILFDVGGVILNEDESYRVLFDSAKAELRAEGIEVSDVQFQDAIEQCIRSFVPGLSSALAWYFTKPDVARCQRITKRVRERELANQPPPKLQAGIATVLAGLSANYALTLAANARSAIKDTLRDLGVLRFFPQAQVSSDIGLSKPDPRFFEHILRAIGMSATECIMIGDRLDNDIIPAKLLGMRAILVRVGPSAILEPRAPHEIPDVTVEAAALIPSAVERILSVERRD